MFIGIHGDDSLKFSNCFLDNVQSNARAFSFTGYAKEHIKNFGQVLLVYPNTIVCHLHPEEYLHTPCR